MRNPAIAALNLGGAVLILIGMFALPWVVLGSLIKEFGELVQKYVPNVSEVQLLIQIVNNVSSLTGWDLISVLPTVTGSLKIVLLSPIGLAGFSLISILLSSLPDLRLGRLAGMIQALASVIIVVFLLMSSSRIRVLGLEPSIFGIPFMITGVTLGSGFWLCLLGLLLVGVGGGLLAQLPAGQPVNRRLLGGPTSRPPGGLTRKLKHRPLQRTRRVRRR